MNSKEIKTAEAESPATNNNMDLGHPAAETAPGADAGGMMKKALLETMNGKPVLYHEGNILTKGSAFVHKQLVTEPGWTLNLGDRCVFLCAYCYENHDRNAYSRIKKVPGLNGCDHCSVVVRREDALNKLKIQLQTIPRAQRFPNTKTVVFTATHVDPAPNVRLAKESAEALTLIFENTNWDVRVLSKSSLIRKLAELVPEQFKDRMILGLSTGTLDNKLAQAIERKTPLVSKRIEALHWLQDNGFRTFGMLCPNLPLEGGQEAYDAFSRDICNAIRIDRCEHVWAEVLNTRKYRDQDSTSATVQALRDAGYIAEADNVKRIFADGNKADWEDYARKTFEAHAKNIPPEKLRFLHYPLKAAAPWWKEREEGGAILLKNDELAPAPAAEKDKNGAVAPARAGEPGTLYKALQQIAVPCTELGGQEIPKCQPVLDDWFMEGDYGIIHGDRGVGKTFLVLSMAVAISGGGKCGPWKANGAPKTLYVDGEMPHGEINMRQQGLGAGENLIVAHHEALFQHAEATFNLAHPAQQNDLARYIDEERVRVLILDNLSVLFPSLSANNDNDDWEPIKKWLLVLRRRKVSVILVGHNGSNGELRGGTRKQDDAAWVIRLDRPPGMEGDGAMFVSQFTKNRHAQRDPADVKWVFKTNKNDGVTNVSATLMPEAEFRRLVESGETSATKIAAKLGVEKGTVAKWAEAAGKAGWMKIDGKGNKAKYLPL